MIFSISLPVYGGSLSDNKFNENNITDEQLLDDCEEVYKDIEAPIVIEANEAVYPEVTETDIPVVEIGGGYYTEDTEVLETEDAEQINAFVKRMYNTALNREAEQGGLDDWSNRLANYKIDGAGVANGFIGSTEFKNRNLSNEDYVRTLYKTFFDRDSYDDAGAPIYNLFYLPDESNSRGYLLATSMNNACAINAGSSQMIYGMGSLVVGNYSMHPVVELSIMAHEFTHMVTDATADLVYQGESGALNESFSDVLGIGVKKYVQGNDASWTIGEGVMIHSSSIRSMSFPKTSMDGRDPLPDTYKGEFWVDTEDESDHGGVHTNSGVQNKWFYLLTDGDSGTNDNDYSYQVEGIGIEKSLQIAYRTLTEYATQESQYADIRLASLQAAEDLYGANSAEVESVGEAWKAVGVDENQTGIESIQNAKCKIQNEDAIYNLAGQRLNKMQKGVNISGGKKVLVK